MVGRFEVLHVMRVRVYMQNTLFVIRTMPTFLYIHSCLLLKTWYSAFIIKITSPVLHDREKSLIHQLLLRVVIVPSVSLQAYSCPNF